MPSRLCPDCRTETFWRLVVCPNCGHEFSSVRRLRLVLLLSGIFLCGCGGLMLYLLAQPPLNLGPFTPWDGGNLTGRLLAIRRAAFGVIALGALIAFGTYLVLWRGNSSRPELQRS